MTSFGRVDEHRRFDFFDIYLGVLVGVECRRGSGLFHRTVPGNVAMRRYAGDIDGQPEGGVAKYISRVRIEKEGSGSDPSFPVSCLWHLA